eukprot:scaffold22407_cov33-Phaeocystis_antarctica.AAC.2
MSSPPRTATRYRRDTRHTRHRTHTTARGGSHVVSGAAVAASSPGSAVAIAMMVGGGRTPPFAAWLGPDWIRTATRPSSP